MKEVKGIFNFIGELIALTCLIMGFYSSIFQDDKQGALIYFMLTLIIYNQSDRIERYINNDNNET